MSQFQIGDFVYGINHREDYGTFIGKYYFGVVVRIKDSYINVVTLHSLKRTITEELELRVTPYMKEFMQHPCKETGHSLYNALPNGTGHKYNVEETSLRKVHSLDSAFAHIFSKSHRPIPSTFRLAYGFQSPQLFQSATVPSSLLKEGD